MRVRINVALFLLAAVALGVLTFGAMPAAAEDDLGTVNQVSEWGPFRYKVYQYPSRVSSFFFYPESYVTFDARNGKYWMIESPKFNFTIEGPDSVQTILGLADPLTTPEKFTIYFYTPDMKLLGSLDNPRANRTYSVPRDGNNYDHIVVKIESHSKQNWDVKFLIWDPVEPVIAEPIPVPTYRE